jgi:hypothetical protein
MSYKTEIIDGQAVVRKGNISSAQLLLFCKHPNFVKATWQCQPVDREFVLVRLDDKFVWIPIESELRGELFFASLGAETQANVLSNLGASVHNNFANFLLTGNGLDFVGNGSLETFYRRVSSGDNTATFYTFQYSIHEKDLPQNILCRGDDTQVWKFLRYDDVKDLSIIRLEGMSDK